MLHPTIRKYCIVTAGIFLLSAWILQAHGLPHTPVPPLRGTVVDDYGHPLAGVRVTVKGGTLSAISDGNGVFRIDATIGGRLEFRHPDFNAYELRVGADTVLFVRLAGRYLHRPMSPGRPVVSGDTISLPAVSEQKIDVLYGQANAESFLGAISTIHSTELGTTPAPSYLYALPGRLAGLNVNQSSGFSSFNTGALTTLNTYVGAYVPSNSSGAGPTDNSEFSVQLRGHAGSFGQNPVAIVDGVQRELYSIDPESIESISILKDPLSNLMLGLNSSRGALIVTTKQPQAGATRLNITAETGMQSAQGLPTPLPAYQYAYMLNEALENNGKPAAYTEADFNAYRNHTDPLGHPDVNWYNTILRKNPLLSRVNLDAAGGSNVARYMINLSYMDEQGMFVTTPANSYNTNLDLKRYLLNSKIDVNVNKDFEVQLQVFGRLQDGNQPGAGTSTILNTLLSTPNNAYPVFNPDGSYGGNTNYSQNLLAQVQASGYQLDHLNDILTSLNLKYNLDKVTRGLWVRATGNVSVEEETTVNRSLQTNVYGMSVNASGDTAYNGFGSSAAQVNTFATTAWARNRFVQLAAGYDRKFGGHSLSATLQFDQKRQLLNYDIPSELTNFAGKLAYNYKGKYFAEGDADYSGYTRYAPGHQYGLFYAGGLGWEVAKEDFFHHLFPWVDRFKLRATYGLTGNANVDYYGYFVWREHYTSVSGSSYGFGSTYNEGGSGGYAEGGNPGSQTLSNISATWERADKFDGGVDLAFLRSHLLFTADYYHERYFNVLQQRGDNIALIGIAYPMENLGIDLYQGAEVELTYQNHVSGFNYFVTGNASVQQSKVLYMNEQYEQNPWNVRTGRPVGENFGYIADGLYQTAAAAAASPTIAGYTPQAGDVKYKDLNGDGVINQFDEAPLGKGRPLIYYGLTLGFNFDGIECSALIQGVGNREEYVNNGYINEGFLSQGNVYSQAYEQILGRWVPENAASATSPRLTAGGNTTNYNPGFVYTSYFLQNGDYWRLKNLHVGYTLPYRLIRKTGLGGIKIFANAQNLFTHAAYKGTDPEVSLPSYPLQKVLNIGVNVKL
jgi:TonB-linked SusC/RagA family outer membrane protein